MTHFTFMNIISKQWARTLFCNVAIGSIALITASPSLAASHRPDAREIEGASGQSGVRAIPYQDLQREAKSEHYRKEKTCKKYVWKNGDTAEEIKEKLLIAENCHEFQTSVRELFKKAEGRLQRYRKEMSDDDDDLISEVEDILDELEDSVSEHNSEIKEVDRAIDKLEAQLKKLK